MGLFSAISNAAHSAWHGIKHEVKAAEHEAHQVAHALHLVHDASDFSIDASGRLGSYSKLS